MARLQLFFEFSILLGILLFTPSAPFALSLTKTQDFAFGQVVGGAGYSGTVTVGTSGERSSSGGIRLLGSVFSPARFTLYGSPGEEYTIRFPAILTIVSGGDNMDVSALTCSVPTTGVIPLSGALAFALGGTLTVKASQHNRTYIGNLDVSVPGN